jgi:hypothetical protein
VELRGFEPLTSAVRGTLGLDAPPLPSWRTVASKAPRWIQSRPALLPFPYERPALGRFLRCRPKPPIACRRLVAPYDHVNVERVELDPATDAASGLGGDEGRAGAEERVNDDVATIGKVEERVLEHGGWLDGRVILEPSGGIGAERRGARISPDVRAPATAFTEFDVVDVRSGAVLE